MSNNIEVMNTTELKKKSLDAKAITILVTSWIVAIIFIIIGIVSLTPQGKVELKEDKETSFDAEKYEAYTLEFTCEDSGYYTILINGATLSEVESVDATLGVSDGVKSSQYEKSYSVYLYTSTEYKIKVTTYETTVDIIIQKTN